MDSNARKNGHNLTRLTISGGNRAEPRLMMAHPKRKPWLAIITVIAVVVIIALAGRSWL